MKKFELTTETKEIDGKTLYRIRALKTFGDVKAGELGGWLEKEENLSHEGTAWVAGSARVSGSAQVSGSAWVAGSARVSGSARVDGSARVSGSAQVSGSAWVDGSARVAGSARVSGSAQVSGSAWVDGSARVSGSARVDGSAQVSGSAEILKPAHLFQLGAIGSRDDFTTFFRTKNKEIFVSCGCFLGPIDEFAEKVKETHRDSKHAKAYALAIELAKTQIDPEREPWQE